MFNHYIAGKNRSFLHACGILSTIDVLLGFIGCFAGSVGYGKGNLGVDEEALTRMLDETIASSEK